MLEAKAPLSIDNFDACDYIFLNHAHPDHYLNIKEFVDKFHPPISVDSLYAAELSRTIGIELAYIFPVDRTQLPLPGLPPRCLLREPQRADRDRLRQLYLHGKAVWHQGHGGAGSIRQPVQHEFHVDPAQWLQGRLCRRNRQSEPSGGVAEQSAKSYDDLPLFLNAKTVAKVLGVSPSSGYELLHDPGFPVMRVGNRMVVPKEQFIQWVSDHTGGGT